MKKNYFYSIVGLAITMASLLSSCNKEDNSAPTPSVPDYENPTNFKGTIPDGVTVTLDASYVYKLQGMLLVADGGVLNIPEGTVIEATTPTEANPNVRYIAVAMGGTININGTAGNPVVMTATKQETESWGGLVICGNAPTNKGGSYGASATAEVSGLTYGGSDVNDASGTVRYLRVEYSGYKYTDEKEFNGISLFAVGAGTIVEYVSSYMGGDDGIEFFGGTVSANHIVSISSGDDGIDFADGWCGEGEFWYVIAAAKSGIEGSNNGDNGYADYPMTDAKLSNMTIYGMGEKPWYFKEGAGKQRLTNIVIGGLADNKDQAYYYVSSDDIPALQRIVNGDLEVVSTKFVNMGEGNDKKATEGLLYQEVESCDGAGNGIEAPAWADGWSTPSK